MPCIRWRVETDEFSRKPENTAAVECAWTDVDGPEWRWRIRHGDALATLKTMPDDSINCCVTSPPYWGLRDYGVEGQMGLESTPAEYVADMVDVFREVRRVLRDDGTLWLNMGDSYCTVPHGPRESNAPDAIGGDRGRAPRGQKRGPRGEALARLNYYADEATENGKCSNRKPLPGLKHKDLIGVPWMFAIALQADGWYLRSDIIWAKPNPMPESVTDRPTKAHEYLFLMSKSGRYYYDADAIAEPSLNAGKIVTTNGADGYESDRMDMRTREGFKRGVVVKDTRNRRSVWTVPSEPFRGAHFAVMPTGLVKPCILAGCPVGGVVLDPFAGSGTTILVANEHGSRGEGIELKRAYCDMAIRRVGNAARQGTLLA